MANFSPGAVLKIGPGKFAGKRFTIRTQAVRMPKLIFQPGLKFERAWVFSTRLTGLKFPAQNRAETLFPG